MSRLYRRQRGFTLLELVVSMAIGVIVVATGFTVYVQMLKVRNFIQAELQLQSNGYFIHQTLRQFVNQAGYRPLDQGSLIPVILPVKLTSEAFVAGASSISSSVPSTAWSSGEYIKANSDGFSFRFEGSSDALGAADGSLANCEGLAIGEGVVEELRFSVTAGTFQCSSSSGGVVDLVSADDDIEVEQLIVRWGVDTDADSSVDEYRLASSALSSADNILSVRFTLLLASKEEVHNAIATYEFDGVSYTTTDKKLRQELVTTVQLKH